ncbi:EamA family transporter, partial [Vibrio cholerae]
MKMTSAFFQSCLPIARNVFLEIVVIIKTCHTISRETNCDEAHMIYLLPFLTVLIWGGNSIVNKLAAATIEPSAMSFYRWLLAMAILTPFCLPSAIRQW